MPIRLRGGGGGSAPPAEAVATRNILNGVLNCAWDKTSAVPKLLEIYDTSKVKLNIDADNPLTLAFANGWDDKDRPAQVIKTLATAPANIDLSGKANCHVQIVAKVINGELVITTHDVYDPGFSTWTNIIPVFTSNAALEGWSLASSPGPKSGYDTFYAVDNSPTTALKVTGAAGQTSYLQLSAPRPVYMHSYNVMVSAPESMAWWGYTEEAVWELIAACPSVGDNYNIYPVTPTQKGYTKLQLRWSGVAPIVKNVQIFEGPIVNFFRSLNKVKDRADVEQLWINLGYATVDAAGAITALTHYTDLRNNYPGGMRVEA